METFDMFLSVSWFLNKDAEAPSQQLWSAFHEGV